MANKVPLIFVRQLKDMLGIEDTYTAQDAQLSFCINVATSWVEDTISRKLSLNTQTQILSTQKTAPSGIDVFGGTFNSVVYKTYTTQINLKNYPISQTDDFTVFYDPSGVFGEDTLVDPSYYTVDFEKGVLHFSYPTGAFRNALKVVYTAGYPSTVDTVGGIVDNNSGTQEKALANALDDDLVQATLWQAALIYTRRYVSSINVKDSIGEGSTKTSRNVNFQAISPEAAAILVRYRRPRIRVI